MAENLTPITRTENFLARIAGNDGKVLEPITREEHFLQRIIDNGSSGGADAFEISFIDDGSSVGRNKSWDELKAYLDSGKKNIVAWYTYEQDNSAHTVPIPVKEIYYGVGGVTEVKFECTIPPSAAVDGVQSVTISLRFGRNGIIKNTDENYIVFSRLPMSDRNKATLELVYSNLKNSAAASPKEPVGVYSVMQGAGSETIAYIQGRLNAGAISIYFALGNAIFLMNGYGGNYLDSSSYTFTCTEVQITDGGAMEYKSTISFNIVDVISMTVTAIPLQALGS
jgi:hypothetical protein